MSELLENIASLSPEERELLELLLAEEGVELSRSVIVPRSRDGNVFPVSFAQQRLWFLDQLEPDSAQYNIPLALRLHGRLDETLLRRAVQGVVERHEVLRTTFDTRRGEPVQVIAPQLTLDFPSVDLRHLDETEKPSRARELTLAEAQRPFDLRNGPLLRGKLLRLADDEHIALLTMHHIVSDGWSTAVLAREIVALYTAFQAGQPAPLPELTIQYADFAAWQREWLQGETLEEQLTYWKEQLADSPPVLDLPTDRPRPLMQTARGARYEFTLPRPLLPKLHRLSRAADATLFQTLLAAFHTLLHRYTRQDTINVGTPVAGRNRDETEDLIGFFVNTLVMRADFNDDPTFRELLQQVRATTLAAYDYQDVPFEMIVEAVQPERDLSHTPLFQVMFLLQNTPLRPVELPGLTISPAETDTGASTFDLTLAVQETPDGLNGSVEYNADLFDESTIARLVDHFHMLLQAITADPDRRVSQLPLLTAAEREQLLAEWNDTAVSYPLDRCVHGLFAAQAERTPQATAVTDGDRALTYAELNGRANQLAHHLQKLGVGPDVLVGLSVRPSLEMTVALLGILKAGGAYLPLDPAYPAERLHFMLDDAGIDVLLTQSDLRAALPVDDAACSVVCIDTDWPAVAAEPTTAPDSETTAENLAYVIYTSGSTGRPKGVLVPHRAVVNHNLSAIDLFRLEANDRVLQFSTINFDAAVEQIFPTWLCGATLVLRGEELPVPGAGLLQLIAGSGLTVLNVPTAYWHELAYWLAQTGEQLPESLRLVVVGGEKASAERLALWQTAVGDRVAWVNTYGPTETTIISTFYEHTHAADLNSRDIPIGRPLPNTQLYVLDRQQQPVPIGVPGELYIGGAGVAKGYLNRPELTAEKFIDASTLTRLNVATRQRDNVRTLYRTGDLVRYRPDGNLEFIGRADDQVKIRGFRVELGEIEATLGGHPDVREGVVIAVDTDRGDKRLIGYLVPVDETPPTTSELRRFLGEKLPEYMIPAAFVTLEAIPLTPSGKLNRRALPVPDSGRPDLEAAYVAPRTPQEELLAGIWAELLHVDQVGVHDNFFDLGGHSLLATQLASRLREAFGVEMPLRELFEAPTVATLVAKIAQSDTGLAAPPIQPVPRESEMPVSFGQQRLWFLDQLEPGSPLYNIPDAVRITGALNTAALEASLNEIVRRHEVLRTTFVMVDGRPMQRIHEEMRLSLPIVDLSKLPPARREAEAHRLAQEEAQRPFNLTTGPLVRARLLKLAGNEHIALLTMHHIASDGWSSGVLVRELAALYPALVAGEPSPLPELPLQYADFAAWQRNWLQGEALQEQLDYWREQLAAAPPQLELPTDRPRPPVQSDRAGYYTFALPPSLAAELEALSRREGVTLFMTLLAAFQTLLRRYSRQDDISVGTPIANRNRAEIENLIGFFVNTLVLRTRFDGDPGFRNLLQQVRETTLGAYAHQDVPFEMVVDALQPDRDLSHTPLFQVMFMLNTAMPTAIELPELTLESVEATTGVAMFDLTLALQAGPDGVSGGVEYNADLFDETTIARMMRHFRKLLEGLVADPERPVTTVPLLDTAEIKQLTHGWNQTAADYPHDKTLHALFAAQAARTPDAVAVVCGGQQLTYAELNGRANQLAHHLQDLGVGPETLVGLSVARSLDLFAGLLGILKAGGAYVPLDPEYPEERLAFMLEDAQIRTLVTQSDLLARLPAGAALSNVVCLDTDWSAVAQRPQREPDQAVQATNLAYVIYTSGSTGKPKGVQVTHRNVVNHNWAMKGLFGLTAQDRMLQFATINFDAAVEEIFPTWFSGATLVLRDGDRLATPADLMDLVAAEQLTVVDLPTAYWHAWVYELTETGATLPESLRLVIVGGEKAAADRLATWQELVGDRVVWLNTYGPTETTIVSTAYAADPAQPVSGEVPIGRPIANTVAYLLDEQMQPVPIGVPGELCIGGDGVARGYLNRPELTAEKFIPDPFGVGAFQRSNVPTFQRSRVPTLYRTGDLARWLPDGNIEYLGRVDHQVKIRGFRVELGEIEAALKAHSAVREAVVVAHTSEGKQRLVAYVTAAAATLPTTGDLRRHLGETLPDYMIPAFFVTLDAFPMTPSGKVDRRRLPAPDSARPELEASYVAPRTPAEEQLAQVWAKVLGLERVGIHDNFFELGGDSILSIQVVARAKQAGLHLTPRHLFEAPTIARLAAVATTGTVIDAEQGLVEGPVPLTPIQHWFFAQDLPQRHHWNQALLFAVHQPLGRTLLEETVAHLLRHHDALRLRFTQEDGGWQQHNAGMGDPVPFAWVDLSDLHSVAQQTRIAADAAAYQASLSLSSGPLLRVVYFDCGSESPGRLLLVIHHLAVDGVSWRILLEDLQSIYTQLLQGDGVQLPPKTTSFRRWAERLHIYAQSEAVNADLPHWRTLAATAARPLPLDFPSGGNSEAVARTLTVELSAAETEALLREVPPVYRTDVNDALLAALAQAVARWSGQTQVLIEMESHGRETLFEDVDISRTVGWFTAVYPVLLNVTDLTDAPGEALKAIKEQLRRVPGRGLSYGLLRYLSEDQAVRAQMAAVPKPQISFNYLGQFDGNRPEGGLFSPAEESRGPDHSPASDRGYLLEINGGISGGQLRLEWSYSGEQYREATIQRLADAYTAALRAIIDHCRNPEAGGVTPSDFPLANLDQKQLDKVLSKMKGSKRRSRR